MDDLQVFGCVSSVGAVSPNSGLKFKWEISDFLDHIDECDFKSPMFPENSADGKNKSWTLCLFQYGDDLEGQGCFNVQLFSTLANDSRKDEHSFTILNNTGVAMVKSTLLVKDDGLIKGDAIFASSDFMRDFVHENKATILCELNMPPSEEIELDEEEQVPSIQKTYEALFNNAKFTDVSLISENKTVKAHKCILANSSSVFNAMFDAEMKEKRENTVEIDDIKYDVVVEMVRYIYTGKVDDMDTLAGELAAAADKYALDELKKSCENSILRNLSLDNVVHCSQLADRLNLNKLKEKTIEFMVENAKNITDKPEFKLLSFDVVHEVCRRLAQKYQ